MSELGASPTFVIKTRFERAMVPDEMPSDDDLIRIGRRLMRRAIEAKKTGPDRAYASGASMSNRYAREYLCPDPEGVPERPARDAGNKWERLARALVTKGHSPAAVAAALNQIREDLRHVSGY